MKTLAFAIALAILLPISAQAACVWVPPGVWDCVPSLGASYYDDPALRHWSHPPGWYLRGRHWHPPHRPWHREWRRDWR